MSGTGISASGSELERKSTLLKPCSRRPAGTTPKVASLVCAVFWVSVCAQAGFAAKQPEFWRTVFYLFLTGVIFFAGISNAILFLIRPAERAGGFLSAVCFSFSVNMLLPNTSGLPVSGLLPWLKGVLLLRLDLLTLAFTIGAAGFLIRELLPRDVSGRATMALGLVSVAAALSGMILPERPFAILLRSYIILAGFFCMYCMYIAGRALAMRRPDAPAMAIGTFAVSIAGGIDAWAVTTTGKPMGMLLLPTGLVVLISAMSFIIAGRFTRSVRASERLREEVKRGESLEKYLRTIQQRLCGMLDSVSIPVMTADREGKIVFANEQASRFFGSAPGRLREISVDTLAQPVTADLPPEPLSMQCGTVAESRKLVQARTGSGELCILEMIRLNPEDESMTMYIFHPYDKSMPGEKTAALFFEELNRNILRLERLDKAFICGGTVDPKAFREDLDATATALERMRVLLNQPLNRRRAAGEVMALSLAYWEECTGESKLELARRSGLWHIEVSPDGFERTRTLDRYLDMRSFPRIPRWGKVLATGDFVLKRCSGRADLRRKLEGLMCSLRLS